MKRVLTSLFFAAMLVVLALCGSAWDVEGSESIQGLISHWKFDEGSGTTAYDSAGDNHGTIYGSPQWTTSQIGSALSFDGVDDYVEVPDDSSLRPQHITLSAWVKPEEIAGRRIIIGKSIYSNAGGEQYALGMEDGIVGIHIKRNNGCNPWTGWYHAYSQTILEESQWYLITGTWDGSILELYINGTLVGSNNNVPPGPIDDCPGGTLRIGLWWAEDPQWFHGVIDDVRIYNRALSAEEVQQLYFSDSPDLVGLEITGPGEVAENFSASYKAIAHYDDDSTRDVTDSALWAVEPNTAANIDENGVLTTKDIVREQAATILASYTEGDVTVEAEKAIDIFAICPIGIALRLDGVDDYVETTTLNDIDDPITICVWIKTRGSDSLQTIFGRNKKSPGGYYYYENYLMLYNDNRVKFGDRPGGGDPFVYSTSPIEKDKWYHISVTRASASDIKIYVNGILDNSGSTNDYDNSGINYRIGTINTGHYPFNGAIDEVAIYNRALSAEEIRANMHRWLTGNEPNLVGYWDFDEGGGQIVYDLSGNGNNGQLGSTPEADSSDPAWVDSDAPIGICTLYQIATLAADRAVECKLALLEELLAALAEEWAAYEALEEWLESGDYGDLKKGDIVKAKQKIHSATQHEEQSIDALEKSIEKLEDALSALGYEPEPPPPPPPPPPGQASNPNPADGARGVSTTANLSWAADPNAASHDVYFGTTSPGASRGNQTATTFEPDTMSASTMYYWRIDEVNAGGTTTGTVWSFTTGGPR